ncbi:MAG TPA: DUF4342 domain-containing protein [Nitrososphaera sp.]
MIREIYFYLFRLLWGAGAAVMLALAPWLAALGVIAGIVTKCTLEVEKF